MKKVKFALVLVFAIMLFGMTAFAKSEKIEIMAPESIEHTLEEQEDSLDAVLLVEENGFFSLELVSISTSGNFEPRIEVVLSKSGKEISKLSVEDEFEEGKYRLEEGLEKGEYRIKITNTTVVGDVSFNIQTGFTEYEYVESVHNNVPEKATEMEPNRKYIGGNSDIKTLDWFSFEVASDGYTNVRMYASDYMNLTLYDEKLNAVGYICFYVSDPEKVYEQRIGLAKGKYYLSIRPEYEFSSPGYSLEVKSYSASNFEKECNNSKENANALAFGQEYNGNLFGAEDEDIFCFEADKKGKAFVKLLDMYLSKDPHYSIYLLDSNFKTVKGYKNCNTCTFEADVDEGIYYVQIVGTGEDNYTNMGYRLSVTFDEDKTQSDTETDNAGQNQPENDSENNPDLPEVQQFDDVKPDAWYAQEILEARKKGLVTGVDDNNFAPQKSVSLAEVITMAAREHSIRNGVNFDFEKALSDGDKWYTPYVIYGISAKLFEADDFEDYEKTATRAQMAYIFSGLFGDDVNTDAVEIPDVTSETEYCEAIRKLYALGILSGNDDKGTFYPEKEISRAEAAVILLRTNNK